MDEKIRTKKIWTKKIWTKKFRRNKFGRKNLDEQKLGARHGGKARPLRRQGTGNERRFLGGEAPQTPPLGGKARVTEIPGGASPPKPPHDTISKNLPSRGKFFEMIKMAPPLQTVSPKAERRKRWGGFPVAKYWGRRNSLGADVILKRVRNETS